MSALVGIATGSGAMRLPDAPLLDYPRIKDLETPERRQITIRQP